MQRLVEAADIELKRSGKDLLARYPFHADAEASLGVTGAKNLWHCFGCQIGGGPIDWVMKSRGVSFRHAVELLKADSSLAAGSAPPVKRSTVKTPSAPVTIDVDDRSTTTTGGCRRAPKRSPTCRKDGAANRERLQKLGILRGSGHEHFNGSLVVPILNEQGSVVEVTAECSSTTCVPAPRSTCTCPDLMPASSTWPAYEKQGSDSQANAVDRTERLQTAADPLIEPEIVFKQATSAGQVAFESRRRHSASRWPLAADEQPIGPTWHGPHTRHLGRSSAIAHRRSLTSLEGGRRRRSAVGRRKRGRPCA